MRNSTIIFSESDEDDVVKKIIPLFDTAEPSMLLFESIDDIDTNDGDKFILYLSEDNINIVIPAIAEKDIKIGLLPHPEMGPVNKALAISEDIEECIKDIINTDNEHEVDLFLCNQIPVFQSVNIGEVFTIDIDYRKNFIFQTYSILKKLWQLKSVRHLPFKIIVDEEKQYSTSALGLVSVEYAQASIITKNLISDTATNDGKLHLLILSPLHVVQVIKFLLNSLIKGKHQKLPDFIGYIKCDSLTIINEREAELTIDGRSRRFKEIELKVLPKRLHLMQPSLTDMESEHTNGDDSFRVQNIPLGNKRVDFVDRVLPWLPKASTEDFKELFSVLRQNSENSNAYMVMMGMSTIIATLGLFANSTPVIIGAMILAPLMGPLVSFSMGMIRSDAKMLSSSIKTVAIGTVLSMILAAFVGIILPTRLITAEMEMRMAPNLLDLGIAVASGIAAAYAHAKEEVAKTLAGVAIAVALIPPLAVAGIGIGWLNWEMFIGASILYITNLTGIILFGGISFILLGFGPFRRARKSLLRSIIMLFILSIPLGFSYFSVVKEAKLIRTLEGMVIENSTLRNVSVRKDKPLTISLSLLSEKILNEEEIKSIKVKIDSIVDEKILLEVDQSIKIKLE